jgi:uncharacterized membrane protein YoaK (UPF0700 family)
LEELMADRPPPEQALPVAILLSAAGGFLDAFTWIDHGGVFANAQSGNVVLLGLFAASGKWNQAIRHVPPIAAFVAGVFVAHRLRVGSSQARLRKAVLASLAIEILLLLVVTVLPSEVPDLPIVLGIAFVAALQSSSFARVETWAYSSVMTTGNLRRAAEALFAATTPPRDPSSLREAGVFATVCVTFGLGATAGGLLSERWHNAAVSIPAAMLGLALLLCLWPLWRRATVR